MNPIGRIGKLVIGQTLIVGIDNNVLAFYERAIISYEIFRAYFVSC